METPEPVRYERRGPVAVLTLCAPQRRNALSRESVRTLLAALGRARQEAARAVVLAAEGPVFCAGAFIPDLRDGWMDGTEADTDPVNLFRALAEMPVPVIAAVQGPALGGGFELTLGCDLVVAGEGAWFCLPELGHGVIPNTALALLPRIVGSRLALDLVLTQRRIPAAEALALGLASRVVPAGEEMAQALELAGRIAAHATPSALAVAKRHLLAHAGIDWPRVAHSLHEVPRREWREGLDAVAEKRAVDYETLWREIGPENA
jgi:enoyl-CoA hydratase/carnithine racemase